MKKELQLLLEGIPPDSRPAAEAYWAKLPADVRRELELSLSGLMKLLRHDPSSFKDLMKLVARAAGPAINATSQVAIVGPVNVGKSTLYNALITDEQKRARSSPVPGTTTTTQTADLGVFRLVDTPGADSARSEGANEREIAFDAARQAEVLLIVFDASGSVTASDRDLYKELRLLQKPFLVVLNKIDLVKPSDRKLVIESAAQVLNLTADEIVTVSAQASVGIDKLLLELTALEPALLTRIGENLPELRRQLGWQAIRRAAISSGMIALSPIPLADVVPLSMIQGAMVLTLARIHGQQLNLKRALELATSLGAGWVARTAFQELSKLGGLPGWVLSGSIAMSATVAIGYTSMVWFETGEKPAKAEVNKVAREAQSRFGGILNRLGRKKVTKEKLTEELEGKLDDSILSEAPAT